MNDDERRADDAGNIFLLIVAVLFALLAFPSLSNYNENAKLGASVRELMP